MAEAASNQPLQIFLCHAEEDKEVVWRLYDRLVEEGAEVWLDKRSILPGQTWEKAIRNAVKKSDVVLVCLSQKFNKKGFRQKEVKWALNEAELMLDEDIYIIPVRLEKCSVPETLANRQWVDLFDEGGDFNRDNYALLLRALREKAKMAGATLTRKSAFFNLPKPKIDNPSKKTVKKPPTGAVKKAAVGQDSAQDAGPSTNPAAPRKLLDRVAPDTKPDPHLTPPKPRRKWNPIIVAALIAAFAAVLGFSPLIKWAEHAFTPCPSKIWTTDPQGNKIAMCLVSAGTFTMGNNASNSDEKPAHLANLPSFYIDVYEVTNALYEACVDANTCQAPYNISSKTRSNYYGNGQFDNYPVVYVDWNMSKTYCEWRGARLPSEAEWERAARGTTSRTYPWGEEIDSTFANYNQNVGDTIAVGQYAKGQSPYGIYDMAGNVWEWVADWYAAYPGGDLNVSADFGQKYRVVRGGAWNLNSNNVRAALRGKYYPAYRANYIGFRCALSP